MCRTAAVQELTPGDIGVDRFGACIYDVYREPEATTARQLILEAAKQDRDDQLGQVGTTLLERQNPLW